MTEGVIWKQIALYVLPLIGSNMLQQLYSTLDLLIIGNWGDADQMASISSTVSLTNMFLSFFLGIGIGASVVMSQRFGAEDWPAVQKTVHTTMALALVNGVILTLLGLLLTSPLLILVNVPEGAISGAGVYMSWTFVGMLPTLIYNYGSGLLRSVGDSKRPLYFLLVSTLVKLPVTMLFVAVFELGVAGAAFATIIAQSVSAVFAVVTLARSETAYRFFIRETRIDRDAFRAIMRVGIPTGLQSVAISLSNVVIQANVNRFGSAAAAGAGVVGKYSTWLFVPLQSFSLAAATFTGQNVGAGRMDRVRRGATITIALSLATSLVIQFVLIQAPAFWISLFNRDPEVIRIGADALTYHASFYAFFCVSEVGAGVIRGIGRARVPMLITLICIAGLRVVWLAVRMPVAPTIDTIYQVYPISWGLASIVTALVFLRMRKGNRR